MVWQKQKIIHYEKIVICADGTWNRPEKNSNKDFPSNVLRLAHPIKPYTSDNTPQQIFYDWGIGSYYDPIIGGATGSGLHKNIMDNYRYIVQNYSPGDELYLKKILFTKNVISAIVRTYVQQEKICTLL